MTKEPFFAPQIVPDLYNYLALLIAVHGSNDLSQCVDYCKGFLSPSVNGKLQDVLKNLQHWDKINQMDRVFIARKELNANVNKGNLEQFREVVYLDMALESYTRQLCEEIFHLEIDILYLFKELVILLENIKFTSRSSELDAAVADFMFFYHSFNQSIKNNRDHALILKASCDRIQRLLGTFVDLYNGLIDSKAKFLGNQFLIDKEFSDMFTEEVIRGSLFFAVSIITKKIDSQLRKLCGLKSWQIISPRADVQGLVIKVDFLHTVAFNKYIESTVIVCNKVTGEEEIPEGVVAVICCTELDALAHVSVRARNNKVLLAVCFDEGEFESILGFVDSWVKITMVSSGISVVRSEKTETEAFETISREVKQPKPLESIAIQSESFGEGKTGAKANNCAELKIRLPSRVGVPSSIALPYGVCEYILSQPENLSLENQIKELINELQRTTDTSHVLKILQSLKSEVITMQVSENHASIIQTELSSIGCNKEN